MSLTNGQIVRGAAKLRMGTIGLSINVFTCQLVLVSIPPYPDSSAIADWEIYLSYLYDFIAPYIRSTFTFEGFELSKWMPPEWVYVGAGAVSSTPAGISEALPSGVAGLVTAYTSVGHVRGRKFLGGLCEPQSVEGFWSSGFLGALAAFAAAYISGFPCSSGGPFDYWQPGVYSKKLAAFVPFNLRALVTNVPAYQRRRKAGVGV